MPFLFHKYFAILYVQQRMPITCTACLLRSVVVVVHLETRAVVDLALAWPRHGVAIERQDEN